jgi:polysaccharide transporter, PST family
MTLEFSHLPSKLCSPEPEPGSMTQVEKPAQNSGWLRFLPAFVIQRLSGRHNLQAILGNSAWQVADKIVRIGVAIFVSLWVARYLGPHRFGQLNYAQALTAVFGAIANLGLDTIVIRELVKFPERRDTLLGSTLVLKLAGASLTLLVVTVLVSILRPGDTLILVLTVLSAAGFLCQSFPIDLYFQSKVQAKYIVLSTNGGFLLMALAKVVLILIGAPLVAFAWAGFFELVLAAAFLLITYALRNQNITKWKCSLREMLSLLRESWPLVFTGISTMISMRVDQILIGQMMNDRQVGLYSAGVRLSELWYFIPVSIAASTYPALVESKKRDEELYYRRLQQLYNMLVSLGIIVAVVMTFLAGPIVHLMFGPAYAASTGALRILIWSGVPVCFGVAWVNWMILEGRAKMLFFFQATSAVVNIILNLVLIPRLGIVGSALATLISYWIGITILAALVKPQRKGLLMLGKAIIAAPALFRTMAMRSGQ